MLVRTGLTNEVVLLLSRLEVWLILDLVPGFEIVTLEDTWIDF